MKSNKLVYLVSTNSRDISSLLNKVFEEISTKKNIEFVISMQSDFPLDYKFNIEGLTLLRCHGLGLSANRNFVLNYFQANYQNSYGIITDDDVDFNHSLTYDLVKESFSNNSADIITGKIKIDSNNDYKIYRKNGHQHNQRSINSVSSIEIIVKSDIDFPLFDEEFGLGSKYKMGEEAIFLGDCLRKGLSVFYSPINLFYHPYESTGKSIDENWYLAKGAFYKRRYGFFWGFFLLVRVAFKMRSNISTSGFSSMIKGFCS